MIAKIKEEYKYSDITQRITGCAMRVHSALGCGFPEIIYQRALAIEMKDEGLIGFAKGQTYNHADHAEFSGELNKIYLRMYHKLGLGRQLVCKVANEFIKRGINSMLLFGDANNPSNKFYEQIGAKKLFAKNGEFHGGYGWTDLKKIVANCKNV